MIFKKVLGEHSSCKFCIKLDVEILSLFLQEGLGNKKAGTLGGKSNF